VEYVLSSQSVQLLAPFVIMYLPAPQSVHAKVPTAALYFPATQCVHVPPFGPVNPVLQTQAVTAVCPVSACAEFDGQLSHSVLAKPATVHVAVKPVNVVSESDVKVTLRKPVEDV
jgi:hypothetical protein